MRSLMLAAGVALLAASAAHAADLAPPPGYILDVAALSSTTSTDYVKFSTSFTAGQAATVVSFVFRRDPSYFGFDDTSLTLSGSSANLLVDPGFEDGPVGSQTPVGWGNFQQIGGIPAQGLVQTGVGNGDQTARSGLNFWDDGAVGAYDGIYQTVATVPGQQYTLSFYLSNPSNSDTYSQTGAGIDVLAYAGATVPGGTVITMPAPPVSAAPEPGAWALMFGGIGLAGLALRRRKEQVSAAFAA